jgi:hypothetical protein
MSRDKRSNLDDPTAEFSSDQSTQSASGLSAGREGPGVERNRESDDVINRADLDTPRRYDQALEDDEDPVMPSDDSTLNTKI